MAWSPQDSGVIDPLMIYVDTLNKLLNERSLDCDWKRCEWTWDLGDYYTLIGLVYILIKEGSRQRDIWMSC